jgi:hypothetical protein
MQVSIGVLLHQNGPSRGERGVSHDKEQESDIRHGKDGSLGEGVLYSEEGILAGRGPVPSSVLLGMVMERAGNIGEVGNEPSIKLQKPTNERTPLTEVGYCHSSMAASFVGSMVMCPSLMTILRYSTSGTAKAHFSSFRYRWLS